MFKGIFNLPIVVILFLSFSNNVYAYGTVSRAGCSVLSVLESITYTVFPSESDDYLYVISHQWTRNAYDNTGWVKVATGHDGWDTLHTRYGNFFTFNNFTDFAFVLGQHYAYADGVQMTLQNTEASNCNLLNWY